MAMKNLSLRMVTLMRYILPLREGGIPERFRWLTAVRSSVLQTSRPHPGKSKNVDETFDCLFDELVR